MASQAEAQAAVDAGARDRGEGAGAQAGPTGGGELALALLSPPRRFVSRGDKLDAALDHFAVDVTGRRVLDAGVHRRRCKLPAAAGCRQWRPSTWVTASSTPASATTPG